MMPQSQFSNQFVSFNDVPIPYDLSEWSTLMMLMAVVIQLILDDINEDASDIKQQILNARRNRKGEKVAKCWEHYKLITTDRIVDGVPKYKAMCKYCQTRLEW